MHIQRGFIEDEEKWAAEMECAFIFEICCAVWLIIYIFVDYFSRRLLGGRTVAT